MATRSQFDTVIIDSDGDALSGVEATVKLAGTGTNATIYSTIGGGGTLANPITTSATGLVQFWADAGSYDVTFHDPVLPARVADRSITWESLSGRNDGIPQAKIENLSQLLPAGIILSYGGSSAPTPFLICDGTAITRSAPYDALFTAIGTTYGVGNGSSTFNIPDLRGRTPVGVDSGAARITSNNALGNSSGAQTVTLSSAQIPSHTHTTSLAPHTTIISIGGGVAGGGVPGGPITGYFPNPSYTSDGGTGGGGSHTNLQPYQVVNYIIKY